MLLIGRKKEIETLNRIYNENKASFLVIYGRKRIGKTELIKHFISNKKGFYFLAQQKSIKGEFQRLKEKFGKQFNIYIEANNFEEFFNEIFEKINKKIVFVIDEFPYWIQQNPEVLSEFQYYWDEILRKKPIMFVIIGSYVSIIENKVLAFNSPLYGRATHRLLLQELPIFTLKKFFPNLNFEDQIKIYGVTDTIPYYMKLIKGKNFKEMINNLFDQTNPFIDDAEFILKEELRNINRYLDILKAINEGATKLTDISNRSHTNITNINKYLNTLLGMKLISKVKPILMSEKEKNYIYQINDNYFKFWLNYIYLHKEEILINKEDYVTKILMNYNSYFGKIFEKIILKLFLEEKKYDNVGKWWYNDQEIDLVAINETKNEILFGECKWRSNVNAKKILKELIDKAKFVRWKNKNRKEKFAIFAKSFKVKTDEAMCIDLKELERIFSQHLM